MEMECCEFIVYTVRLMIFSRSAEKFKYLPSDIRHDKLVFPILLAELAAICQLVGGTILDNTTFAPCFR